MCIRDSSNTCATLKEVSKNLSIVISFANSTYCLLYTSIEIPKVNGTIDEAVVNNKITELENKAKVVLAKNPAKLRKILAWLNNFREVSLAWHLTATDGYLQALANFEKTQLNG